MRKISQLVLLLLLIFTTGCLTYERVSVKIVFDNPGKALPGKIYISFIGIASTEDSLEKRRSDFDDVVDFLENDDFLLDAMKDGIYVKHRKLLNENNKLVFIYDGIFDKLVFDRDLELKYVDNEIVAFLNEEEKIENTNGKIFKDSTHTFIKWPRDTKEIYWDQIMVQKEKIYSLLPFFEKWKNDKK